MTKFEIPVILDRAHFPGAVALNPHTKNERNGAGIW
jgi:hypothetical protein